MKPNAAARQKALEALREIAESDELFASRIAQAMETGIRWATETTVGWPLPHVEAKAIAKILESEVIKSVRFRR